MIIDFEHHFTPAEIWKKRGGKKDEVIRVFANDGTVVRTLIADSCDVETHLKDMDIAGIDIAVLSSTADNLDEAKIFNNEVAVLVKKYPKRFIGFALTNPLGGKPAFDELDRAIKSLGLKGVTVRSQIDGVGLDSDGMWPFYEKVSRLRIPIFVHIAPTPKGFEACKASYELNRTLAREFDLTVAAARLCLGGVLEEFPDLVFIIAHFGGCISSVKERLDRYVGYWGAGFWTGKPPIREPYKERFNEHFKKLYFNTAGREIGIGALACALTSINPRRLLFGTDYPFNFGNDPYGIKEYITAIKGLDLDRGLIEGILSKNGIELLGMN